MKRPAVLQFVGLFVLLLSGMAVSAVLSMSRPAPPFRLLWHVAVIVPYSISTFRLLYIHCSLRTGCPPVISMEMAQNVEGARGLDEEYNDITGVTTEHDF